MDTNETTSNGEENQIGTQNTISDSALNNKVNELLNGSEPSIVKERKKTIDPLTGKRVYRKSKIKKKRKYNNSNAKPEPNVNNEDLTKKSDEVSAYDKLRAEWEKDLDPDARKDEGFENIEKNEDLEISKPNVTQVANKKLGRSLVVLTQFVLPILCSLSARLISRGKKKIPNSQFRLDDFEKEMLNELAEDAGEEILGNTNKGLVYLIVVFALGANKTMEEYDKVPVILNSPENSIPSKTDFDDLRAKYEELLQKFESSQAA